MTSNTLLQRINQHQHLKNLRNKLLKLHKVLLDAERITYEQASGRISSGEFLQLVINHEQFAWLHSISEVIVQIDEILTADEPISPDNIKNLLVDIRTLLSPSEYGNTFARKYYTALQGEPGVILAHAEVSELLASA
ncbi:hypothetical protein [Nostoc sp. MS1]|uniref:hypothetical protein n=1 Tax=Nostoc sp. MS1 TaxID=2764711 RepID=UPI001CC43711|nr:hypothetical protein [Nostoc sp. MS1]BCL34152.1 hypothetical protein NSMS1_05990 [Nostoc sp. MS1]